MGAGLPAAARKTNAMQRIVDALIAEMEKMPVIDTHEHFFGEQVWLQEQADVFTRLYCHYSTTSAITAGLKMTKAQLHDTSVPIEERWRRFRPYLDLIRDTGYARTAQAAARALYGVDDITDDNYLELSERLQADNTPGQFERVLRDRCNIEVVLNQADWPHPMVRRNTGEVRDIIGLSAHDLGEHYRRACEVSGQIEDAETLVRARLDWFSREGYVGLKYRASCPTEPVADADAASAFRKLRDATLSDQEAYVLSVWLSHKGLELAPQYGLAVPVHCGLGWCCGSDFRDANPLNMIPLLMRYPDTTFDLYHAGIPWVREIGVMGNQYPNVCLNLVWCHQISPYMTEHMLNEWIDLVPVNKIIGFGGDNAHGPEKTLGVLILARENIARALAVRITRGQMNESRALDICRAWLYDNPKRIYNL